MNYTNEVLAEMCGFGSVNSMKRAIFAKTGLNLTEWKQQTLNSPIISRVVADVD
jgi:hypothetical protein